MSRILPDISIQSNSRSLRNQLCRLKSPKEMAEVSSHLRNFAVAETIGLIGLLDSHPQIKGKPHLQRGGAVYQQCIGTHPNPFTHVIPSNIMLNDKNLTSFFKTEKAQTAIERIFGMGVMAPDNWAELDSFNVNPAQLNIADNIAERFLTNTGLVAVFEKTINSASDSGTWNSSAQHQHNASSLVDYITQFYSSVWKPEANEAYQNALLHLNGKLSVAKKSGKNDAIEARIKQRIELIGFQMSILNSDTLNFSEAAGNVITATSAEEEWSGKSRPL